MCRFPALREDDRMGGQRKRLGITLKTMLVVFLLTCCALQMQPSFAASGADSPGRPIIRSVAVKDNTVTVKWSKAKRATTYKVYVRTGADNKWKYLKKVKKTSANKKKYSNKINYKIVTSGKKYKVYKRANPFRLKATVEKRTYTFRGEYGTRYALIVKPYAGKTAGTRSKIKTVMVPEKEGAPGSKEEQNPEYEPEPEPAPESSTDPDAGLEPDQTEPDTTDLSQADPANVDAVRAYAARLYNENMIADRDYIQGGFTWDQENVRNKAKDPDAKTYGWKYYNALLLEAFLSEDPDNASEILRFYDSHINENGELLISSGRLYPAGILDGAMPGALMIKLVNMGATDEEQTANYTRAANTIYNKLENQYMYDGNDGRPYAGKLWMHHQIKDPESGEIVPASVWSKWPVCVDGIYMSQIFLIRLAEAIDSGSMVITSVDGHTVTSQELWDDICTRLDYTAKVFRNDETGLISHVYSPERGEANNISWSRGTGWFMMAMLEAIECMPKGSQRNALQEQFDSLMRSVLEWQDPESLLWYNVMTRKSDLAKNRPETSGSAMISYCLLRGYKDGILKDEEFRRAGLMAFNAMVKYHYSETEGLADTLISMGPADTEAAYQNPKYVANEAKGIAPLIMASEYVNP